MKIGYARVSSNTQDHAAQVEALKAAGCDRIFSEKASGKTTNGRPEFAKLMKARDISAMEILYDRYSQVLYGVIYWITNDEKKSEEILFQTFTYIWNHYNGFDVSAQNICFWMVSVARSLCFETMTKEERLKVKDQWLAFLRERGADEQLEMLGYAFFKGMSIQEMAQKFNCTESAIRSQLHEAVAHLKKEYVAR